MNRKPTLALFAALFALVLCLPLAAETGTRDWPVWNGPNHDLTVHGDGVFTGRTAVGLEPLWSRPLGSAYSGISAVGDRLVTGFSDGASDFVVALAAASGEELWRYRVADTYKGHDGSDDGLIATPAIAGEEVYGLGPHGQLFALRLKDGSEIWSHQLPSTLGARKPHYGFSTSPLVAGDVLVVQAGGDAGRSIAGFDRRTGELRWSTGDDKVGYQSPVLLTVGGRQQVLAVTNRHLLGLDPATGEVLWRHDRGFPDDEEGMAHPVPIGDDRVLLAEWTDAALYRVAPAGAGGGAGYAVEEVWRTPALRTSYTIPVPYGDHVYGLSGRFLTCVDAATGETVWKSRPPGGGSLVLVDGHLVIQAPGGELVVAKASPAGYEEVARLALFEQGGLTHPTFANGRLYARNLTDVAAVAITDRTAAVVAEAPPLETRGLLADLATRVQAAADPAAKKQLVDDFLTAHPRSPIVEGDGLVHFVYRGEVEDLALGGNFLGREQLPMQRLPGTDFYFRSHELTPGGNFAYRFFVFDKGMADPRNPDQLGYGERPESEVRMPGWVHPAHLAEPTGARGRIEKLTWKSEQLDAEREVQVYLPAGYDAGEERYPLLLVYIGDQALSVGLMDRTLDNLIGESVAPVIVAFLPRTNWPESAGSAVAEHARAVVEELVPHLDATYRTEARAESRAFLGAGFGSFFAAYATFVHPGVFGKVALQSFFLGDLDEELNAAVAGGERQELEIFVSWTRHEVAFDGGDGSKASRDLVASLEQKGYAPVTLETGDGPGWGAWRAQSDRVLTQFFPRQ